MSNTFIKPIVKMGDPILSHPSQPITNINDPGLQLITKEMIATMQHHQGVGIAAPQIGYPIRLIAYGFEHCERYPNESATPLTILANLSWQPKGSEKVSDWEGCLSVPGLRGKVERYQTIQYQAIDLNGDKINAIAEGFVARILQHECDHIDGRLFPSQITDFSQFGFEDSLPDFKERTA